MFNVLLRVILGLLIAYFVFIAYKAWGQTTPTPLPPIKREPYSPKVEPPVVRTPRDDYIKLQEAPFAVPPPTFKLIRLPRGAQACSLDPQGEQVCGNSVWLRID
jgi:hypothetical protein